MLEPGGQAVEDGHVIGIPDLQAGDDLRFPIVIHVPDTEGDVVGAAVAVIVIGNVLPPEGSAIRGERLKLNRKTGVLRHFPVAIIQSDHAVERAIPIQIAENGYQRTLFEQGPERGYCGCGLRRNRHPDPFGAAALFARAVHRFDIILVAFVIGQPGIDECGCTIHRLLRNQETGMIPGVGP
ncbi:hypothetical protein ES703_116052 [subsurface metagenome]